MSRLRELTAAVLGGVGRGARRRASWMPLRKPLSECTLALISSSAYVDAAPQFDTPGVELCAFRAVSGIEAAPETASQVDAAPVTDFEADRLRVAVGRAHELVASGRVGRLADRHLILAGAVDSRRRIIDHTHQAARILADDQVDVVLLVPM